MGATLEREASFFGQGRVRALLSLFEQTERMLHYHGGKSRDSTHGRGRCTECVESGVFRLHSRKGKCFVLSA
ncbi:hypothetical protein T10_4910 [Trichinella papuae]|uniref:Uncharacterized protein n=1 Tax=Trichinella papuae TaxID=268474 RepID=A0A0V1MCB8_9BILA|nr:hypothetical protein T10_4910 [Trichinella papuae]